MFIPEAVLTGERAGKVKITNPDGVSYDSQKRAGSHVRKPRRNLAKRDRVPPGSGGAGDFTTKGFRKSLDGLDVPGPGKRAGPRPGGRKTLPRPKKRPSQCASRKRPRGLKFRHSKVLEGHHEPTCPEADR